MTIDWNHFTPVSALSGGLLIGVAAAMLALVNGRVAGVSGIVGGLLRPTRGDIAWRIAFFVGLIVAPIVYRLFVGLPEIHIDAGIGTLTIAGVIVGIGTRYGSGCTSGHGVCGVSRLSPRSAVAAAAFMFSGFVTVFIVRHLLG